MIPLGTLSPVTVIATREFKGRDGKPVRVIRVSPDPENDREGVEFFLAPGANGHDPKEGELVHLRIGARSKGWETHHYADGTSQRKSGGTAYSVREIAAA